MELSIRSQAFIEPVVDRLNQGKKLVVWHQIPWAGGAQDWYLIHHLNELYDIFEQGRPASAFTVYEWLETSLPNAADDKWLAKAIEILQQETPNTMILLQPLTALKPVRLAWIGLPEDLTEWLAEHRASLVQVGRIPNVWTGEIVRGYFPNSDGTVRSGAY